MKAAVLEKAGQLVVREMEKPAPNSGEVLARVCYCGICGTDLKMFRGEYAAKTSVVPGHELAGVVAAVGDQVKNVRIGDRVAVNPNISCGTCNECGSGRDNLCRHLTAYGVTFNGGFAEYMTVPETRVCRLKPDADLKAASFAEPLSCALHAVDRAGEIAGRKTVVIGGGIQGLLLIQLLKQRGVGSIVLLSRSGSHAALAEKMGADLVVKTAGLNTLPEEARSADVVIEAAGSPETLETAFNLVAPGGIIVLYGLCGNGKKICFTPYLALTNEVSIVSAWLNPGDTFPRAVELLQSGSVQIEPLVSMIVSLNDINVGFERALDKKAGFLKALVRCTDENNK